jgi:hypothetical protein
MTCGVAWPGFRRWAAPKKAGPWPDTTNELAVCGALAFDLCGGIRNIVQTAILNAWQGDITAGWSYAGDGIYRSEALGTVMDFQLFAGDDYAFAADGEPIPHNVFALDNISGASTWCPSG